MSSRSYVIGSWHFGLWKVIRSAEVAKLGPGDGISDLTRGERGT